MTTYDTYEDVPRGACVTTGSPYFEKIEPFRKIVKKDFNSKKGVIRDAIGRIVLVDKKGKEIGLVPTDPELYYENLGAEQSGAWGG
jgi:hypothetical protein